MERTAVVVKLTTIFRKVFSNDSLALTNELTANNIDHWDSLTHMLLITEIENTFSIQFRLKELNKMKNVGEMIELIISKL
jgi:acyl carrier protein